GFSTMNDLLAVSDFAREKNLPIISIYGEKDARLRSCSSVLTMQPPAEFLVKKLFTFLEPRLNRLAGKRALIVTTIDQQSFEEYKEEYAKSLKKHRISVDTVDILERKFDEP